MSNRDLPDWVITGLGTIQQMEISLGNIPSSDAWQTRDMEHLLKTLEERDDNLDPIEADVMFEKIVKKISKLGLTPAEIAKLANSHIGYKGGPPYCNEEEIREILDNGR